MVPSLLLSTLSLPTFRGIPFSPKPTKERKKKNDKLTNLETRVNKMKHFFNVQVHEQNQSLLGSGYIRFAPATSCGGGLGMMLSYVRTLLFFSDDILHLARSDVLVMGRSTMSVAVATLSSGVVILNGWDIKYPHEFIHAVPWRRDGSGKRDELLHQLKAADHANGIQQRRRRASEQKV